MFTGPKRRNRRRALRLVGGTALLLVLLGLVAAGLLGNYYKKLIRKELPAAIAKATDGLYLVTIEDVHVNLITRHLTVDGIHLWPDPQKLKLLQGAGKVPPAVADINIPELQVQGARWFKRRDGRHIELKRLWLGGVNLHVTFYPQDSSTARYRPLHSAADKLAGIRIGSIAFSEPQISVTNLSAPAPWQGSIGGGEIELRKFEYRPGAADDSSRLLNSEGLEGYVRGIQWMRQRGGWYRLRCDSLAVSTEKQLLDLRNFSVLPAISNEAIYAATGYRMEIYRANIPALSVEGFSLTELIRRKTFLSRSAVLDRASLDIYYSRLLPKKTKPPHGTFPQQLLARLPLALQVPVLKLQDCSVSYTELSDLTRLPATISFKNIDGSADNISNRSGYNRQQPECNLRLSGHFQDRTDISVHLKLRMDDSSCAFSLKGRLGSVEAVQVNGPARAWGAAEVRNLRVQGMELELQGNRDSSWSSATLLYDRLKLKVQAVDSNTRQLRLRPFISLLANKMLLYPANPMPGGSVRVVQATAIPELNEPFLHLIWRHLFQAGARTTVHDDGMLGYIKNRQERRNYKAEHGRRHFFRNLFPKRQR